LDNRKITEATLSKLLKSDSNALSELAQLLESAGVTSAVMISNIVGDRNIVGQASGSASVAIDASPTPRMRPKAT
jgi:glycerate-2-kinase